MKCVKKGCPGILKKVRCANNLVACEHYVCPACHAQYEISLSPVELENFTMPLESGYKF